MKRAKAKIGSFLTRSKIPIDILDSEEYKRVTIRINHNGISVRDLEIGKKIGTKKQFILKAGQFLMSKIDARYGAFGIAPEEVNGAIITGNFWAYNVDFSRVNIEWFNQFTNSPQFYELCERASTGITHRKYLSEPFFLNYEIDLPPIEEQLLLIGRIKTLKIKHRELTLELNHQVLLIKKLRQQLLQDAIQGKIVAQHPNDEPATILLQKIKTKKEQLVIDKKLKKEKELPQIKPDEIPFEIPKNWIWCRLGEICTKIGSGSTPSGSDYSIIGIPFFRSQNIYESGLIYDDIKFISDKVHKKMNGTTVYANDILLNITGGSLGRCVKVPEDFIEGNVSQHVCIIRPIGIDNNYLHKQMLSPFFQGLIFSSTTGAGREGLPKYNLEQFLIPLPPLAEQHRIVQKLEQLMQTCDALEASIKQSQQQNEQLLQQVLREALTKEIKQEELIEAVNVEFKNDDKHKALLLAAEIIWQLNQKQTLGHIKLQKLIYLCNRTQKMNLPVNFLKWAMGPYDPELQKYIDTLLVENEWYNYDEDSSLKYQPLKHAGGHKEDFDKYFASDKPAINHLIQLFENAKSARIEIVATLFACWDELISKKQLVNDNSLLAEFYNWSEKKKKHTTEKVIDALRWMETQGLVPN